MPPNDVGDRDQHVVEVLLTELGRAVDHLDPLHLDTGLVDLQDEHGQALVLGHARVRPGQAERVVGPERTRTPDLRPVEDEDVAVPGGRGDQAGQIGAATGLGEELHPQLVTPKDGRDVAKLLLFGPEIEDGGGQDGQRGDVEGGGHLVAHRLLGERPLVGAGQTLASVLGRVADPRVAPVEQEPLELAGPHGHLVLLGQVPVVHPLGQTRHIPGQPGPRTEPVGLQLLGVDRCVHRAPFAHLRPPSRWRCARGGPGACRTGPGPGPPAADTDGGRGPR